MFELFIILLFSDINLYTQNTDIVNIEVATIISKIVNQLLFLIIFYN